ncbi:hypothetical protein AJ80_01640 [Polytolypa hystricis UAMH7299]|uniref:N-glycosylation protein EOS1 n=1 Tax=Polytolypa hystricis (strain UAMH7299) TaxID=1447883 RepID=A0A2B7YRQ0_POLH7|nr:hypothetical protein AJ80_01640 [Polytolypa hystricis UAMH7299]
MTHVDVVTLYIQKKDKRKRDAMMQIRPVPYARGHGQQVRGPCLLLMASSTSLQTEVDSIASRAADNSITRATSGADAPLSRLASSFEASRSPFSYASPQPSQRRYRVSSQLPRVDRIPSTPPPPFENISCSPAADSNATLRQPAPHRNISSDHHNQRTPASSNVVSALHPRVAVFLGVDRRWYLPLLVCRALSVAPAAWWGLRCAITFLAELLRIRLHLFHQGWTAAVVRGSDVDWDSERQFRVMEVALAIIWCSASAYLSYFFADCLMSRWLLNYTPPAVIIRLLTINCIIAYLTSWILYLTGAAHDPRLLLPAWISITAILTFAYHITQRQINIKKETSASLSVFSIASFVSMCALLLQLHLSRANEHDVPFIAITTRAWEICADWLVVRGIGTQV